MKKIFGFNWRNVLLCALCILPIICGTAFGAGFALMEQSVSGLGNAFAGGAASAEDATTVFFNPAGMTRISNAQFVGAGHLIITSDEFRNEGSTHILQGVTGIPLLGNDGGDAGVTAFVPNVYIVKKMSERFAVGLGVNVPFGLETDYRNGWVGRYHALNSEVMTLNINPSIAMKIDDHLSVGGGISFQYINAELSNAIDFGTLDAIGAFAPLGIPAGALGLIPQGSDGLVELEGDDWSVGFNLGLLYEFTRNTRVGFAYRSQIKQHLRGDADFSNVPGGLAAAPVFKDGDIEADVTLPDSIAVSFYHRINPAWALMGDVTWTHWSLFDELRIEFKNPFQADGVTTTEWENNFRYSLGLTFNPNEEWTIRSGVAYDETPIPDARRRSPRIPGEDRLWLSGGLGYRLSDRFSFDVAYTYIFVDDAKIAKDITDPENAVRGGLTGTYDADVNIVSAQIVWSF